MSPRTTTGRRPGPAGVRPRPDGERPDAADKADKSGTGPGGSWRGVATEDADDLPDDLGLRLRSRSRRLLGDLLAPYRRVVLLLCIVVVAENAARLSVGMLVQFGLFSGVPPVLSGGWVG